MSLVSNLPNSPAYRGPCHFPVANDPVAAPQPRALGASDRSTFEPASAGGPNVRTRPTLTPPNGNTGVVGPAQAQQAGIDPTVADAPQDPAAALDALKASTPVAEKREFLSQTGVDPKRVGKASDDEVNRAFDSTMDALKKPGETKFKTKLGGKTYEAKVKLDPATAKVEVQFKEKKGFFGKLWDGIKTAGKLALGVASFIPGPVGIAARVGNAVAGAIGAIKNGDVLGGIAAGAGAIAGGANAIAGQAVGGIARMVGNVAGAVANAATGVQGAISAARGGDWSGFLGAIASGAHNVAGALGNTARGVSNVANEVATWATRGNEALQAVVTAKNGDVLGAIAQGADVGKEIAGTSKAGNIFSFVGEVARGLKALF